MPDYKAMYHRLFHAVTDVVNILQVAQIETEAMYVDHEPAEIISFRPDDGVPRNPLD
jgi:hypothetical protein